MRARNTGHPGGSWAHCSCRASRSLRVASCAPHARAVDPESTCLLVTVSLPAATPPTRPGRRVLSIAPSSAWGAVIWTLGLTGLRSPSRPPEGGSRRPGPGGRVTRLACASRAPCDRAVDPRPEIRAGVTWLASGASHAPLGGALPTGLLRSAPRQCPSAGERVRHCIPPTGRRRRGFLLKQAHGGGSHITLTERVTDASERTGDF